VYARWLANGTTAPLFPSLLVCVTRHLISFVENGFQLRQNCALLFCCHDPLSFRPPMNCSDLMPKEKGRSEKRPDSYSC
jgi:hypothetical protein